MLPKASDAFPPGAGEPRPTEGHPAIHMWLVMWLIPKEGRPGNGRLERPKFRLTHLRAPMRIRDLESTLPLSQASGSSSCCPMPPEMPTRTLGKSCHPTPQADRCSHHPPLGKPRYSEASAQTLLWGGATIRGDWWGGSRQGLWSMPPYVPWENDQETSRSLESFIFACAGWRDLGNIGTSYYSVPRKGLMVPKSISECKNDSR